MKALRDISEEYLGRDLYLHYSFVSQAASFSGGLWPNPTFVMPGGAASLRSYATQDVYVTGWQAHWFMALPSADIQDAAYIVMPREGFEPIGPSRVTPLTDLAGRNLHGGGKEYIFWGGSGGPGTVFGPIRIPEGQSPVIQN